MAINYPYRVFRYQVEIDGISRAGFSEVSGMSSSTDAVEYREGDDLRNTPRKLAGLTKFGNVTLRWGVSDDSDFLDWVYSVAPTNTAPPTGMVRHNVTITLIDDAGNPGPSWNLINAWEPDQRLACGLHRARPERHGRRGGHPVPGAVPRGSGAHPRRCGRRALDHLILMPLSQPTGGHACGLRGITACA